VLYQKGVKCGVVMSITELGVQSRWVRLSDVCPESITSAVIRLRRLRPCGLWEIRNGEIWVNRDRFDEISRCPVVPGTPPRDAPSPSDQQPDIDLRATLTESTIVRWEWRDLCGWEASEQPYVYFVECQGYVKIGVAKSPHKRMANMQSGNPFPLTLWGAIMPNKADAFTVEAALHHWFWTQHHSLEWFHSEVLMTLEAQITYEDLENGRDGRI